MKFNLVKFKAKRKKVKNLECLNCGQPFLGDENFCSYCGQKNTNKKLSIGTFIHNLSSGFLSYDSRFWRTFIPLLIKPGEVSKEYIAGKRARFVNPFQLYLNVSIIFFLILGISNRLDIEEDTINNIVTTTENIDSLSQEGKQQLDSVLTDVKDQVILNSANDSTAVNVITDLNKVINLANEESKKPKGYHIKTDTTGTIGFTDKIEDFYTYYKKHPKEKSNNALSSLGYNHTFRNNFYYNQVKNTHTNYEQLKNDGGKSYVKKLTSFVSISLFIFLPIFTLFLTLIYFRRNYTYMEHLVFVFNTQTVFFLLLTIFFLLNFMVDLENVAWVFIVLFLLYLYKAMRNFYQQSRGKTILKFILLNSFYLFLGLIGLVIVGAISFVAT